MRVCPQCGSIYTSSLTRCTLDDARIIDQVADPLVGRQLDRYHIEERLGVGGMGCVYSARHAIIDRSYAIKVLFGDYANNEKFQARFRREATSISKIRHPNIVQVEDFGQTPQGLTFLAMELVRGKTLEAQLAEGRLPPAKAFSITRQIADGLWAAHRLGFVHRDVKPANIMLAPTPEPGFVKLLDFGAVSLRSTPPNDRLTAVGHIIGTPTYMAPEQMKNAHVPPTADVYALGVILFEMLTGKPPFNSRHPTAVLVQHMTEPPPRAPTCRGLGQLVGWMLQKNPEERPQSMGEVLEALDQLDLNDTADLITMAPLADSKSQQKNDPEFYAAPTNQVSLGDKQSELQNLYAKLDAEADDIDIGAGNPEITSPDNRSPTRPDSPLAAPVAPLPEAASSWGTWINEFAGLDVPPTTELTAARKAGSAQPVIKVHPAVKVHPSSAKPAQPNAITVLPATAGQDGQTAITLHAATAGERANMKTAVVRKRLSPALAAAPMVQTPVAISAEGAPPTQISPALAALNGFQNPPNRTDTPILTMAPQPDATHIEIDHAANVEQTWLEENRSHEHEMVYPVTHQEEETEADEPSNPPRPLVITAPVPHLNVVRHAPAHAVHPVHPVPSVHPNRPQSTRPSVIVQAPSPRWHYVAAGILLIAVATLGYAIAYGPTPTTHRAVPAVTPR